VNNAMRYGLVVGVVMVVLIGCSRTPTGEPTTTASPGLHSAAPSIGPADPTPGPVTDVVSGGRYAFRPLPDVPSFTIVATGPNGWVGYPSWAMDGPEPVRADAPTGIGISFFTADGVYSDPCHWDLLGTGDAGQPGDAVVGRTVDDLVAALRANTFYTSSVPTPVTIDGYAGQELELQLPEEPQYATCDKEPGDSAGHVFVFAGPGLYAQGQANRWHLYILDVTGTRLIAVILAYAGTPQADLDTAQSVIDTMDINP
jgi:hypothetical protein